MRKETKKALIIAIIGAAVWILSFIIAIFINVTTPNPDFDTTPSPVPFLVFFLIGGLGFITAMVSGIIWLLFYLQDRNVQK